MGKKGHPKGKKQGPRTIQRPTAQCDKPAAHPAHYWSAAGVTSYCPGVR